MSLTSERVHWLVGAALIGAALHLFASALGKLKGRWLDFVLFTALQLSGQGMKPIHAISRALRCARPA